jgi:hypothetical protein
MMQQNYVLPCSPLIILRSMPVAWLLKEVGGFWWIEISGEFIPMSS